MRLVGVTVANFRCYDIPTSVRFSDMTALVGQNDVGKSTILEALAIFFEEAKLDADDACRHGDRANVSISCEFDELPDSLIVDADVPTSLQKEYLVSVADTLVIKKTYDGSLATPKLRSTHAIANHPTAENYHDLLSLKRNELVARANELGVDLTSVDERKNAALREAIWMHCPDLQRQIAEIELEVEGAKQVWKPLQAYLPSFALFKSDRASSDQDAEAQDPLKAAIQEAVSADHIRPMLAEIQDHVENEVQRIADATVEKLKEVDPDIASSLDPVIKTKKWETLFNTSITGDDDIPLNKRGSGVRRLVLLNFFRAKAEKAAGEAQGNSVIYAIEEPETSQHPKNQRRLLNALREIASTPGRQVLITTHTPMLARYLSEEDLRLVTKPAAGGRLIEDRTQDLPQKIAASLGVLPDHAVKLFIGVEGPHDIRFLKAISNALVQGGEQLPDLDALEIDNEIIFFPFGGSNLAVWTTRLSPLNRPEYHIYDRDNPPPADAKYAAEINAVNQRTNCSARATTKRELENYLHFEAVNEAFAANGYNIQLTAQFRDFDDVPSLVAQAWAPLLGQNWNNMTRNGQKRLEGRAKKILNSDAAGRMNTGRLNQSDANNELRSWLNDIQAALNV